MEMDYKALTAAAIAKIGSGNKLAKRYRITPGAVSQWRNGRVNPSTKHVLDMLQITGRLMGILAMITLAAAGTLLPAQDTHAASNSANSVYYVKWRTLLDLITSWIKTTTIKTIGYA